MTYTLVLLRHGESEWNAKNLFTGWVDVALTEKGRDEAVHGGRLIKDAGVLPDVVHTSLQRRAINTAALALDAADDGIQENPDAGGGEAFRDMGRDGRSHGAGEQPVLCLHDSNAPATGGERRRDFKADEAAADDDDILDRRGERADGASVGDRAQRQHTRKRPTFHRQVARSRTGR